MLLKMVSTMLGGLSQGRFSDVLRQSLHPHRLHHLVRRLRLRRFPIVPVGFTICSCSRGVAAQMWSYKVRSKEQSRIVNSLNDSVVWRRFWMKPVFVHNLLLKIQFVEIQKQQSFAAAESPMRVNSEEKNPATEE